VENGMTSAEYHPKSRPEECEAEAVNRILTLAHVVGDAPIYIVHLTSNMGLDYIKMARQRGQKNIYVETCTQYLVLDEELYKLPGTEGLKYVMSPPLREKSNQLLCLELIAIQLAFFDTIRSPCSFNKIQIDWISVRAFVLAFFIYIGRKALIEEITKN